MKCPLKSRRASLPLKLQVQLLAFKYDIELQHVFKHYDTNSNGSLTDKEFKQVLIDLGRRDITDEEVKAKLQEADSNSDGQIQWDEYLEVSIKWI